MLPGVLRLALAAEASMRGAMRMAPNPSSRPWSERGRPCFNEGGHAHGPEWRAGRAGSGPPRRFNEGGHAHGPESRRGSHRHGSRPSASMRGAMRMAPNARGCGAATRSGCCFNEGGHAHGPEFPRGCARRAAPARFNEGGHAHGPEWSTGGRGSSWPSGFNEGGHAHGPECLRGLTVTEEVAVLQ